MVTRFSLTGNKNEITTTRGWYNLTTTDFSLWRMYRLSILLTEDSREFSPNPDKTLRTEHGHLHLIPDPYSLLFCQVLYDARSVKLAEFQFY